MERVGGDVRRELARFGPALALSELGRVWPALVGEAIAANAWPARLARDGTLHVHTADSIWAFELGQQAPEILARLQRELRESAPRALRFRAGLLPERSPEEPSVAAEPPPRPGPEELRRSAELTAAIEDPELRRAAAGAVSASLARAASTRRF